MERRRISVEPVKAVLDHGERGPEQATQDAELRMLAVQVRELSQAVEAMRGQLEEKKKDAHD